MLTSLYVSNYALIDKVQIDFNAGFSVITGETGAGKSILLGALGLILGQRSDLSALKDKSTKSIVEAVFNIKSYNVKSFFDDNDVDYDDETTFRREILPSGKSRAFVNDTPVGLNFLKSLSGQLVDVHSQHQNLLLGESHFQLSVVDAVADNKDKSKQYTKQFKQYKALLTAKSQMLAENQRLKADADYKQFQYDLLAQLNLVIDEQDSLESERQQGEHAEEIKTQLYSVSELLNNNNTPILPQLKEAQKNIEKIATYLPEGEDWIKRLDSAYLELEDLSSEIEEKQENISHDPERLSIVSERLDQIYSLQQKHACASIAELINIQNKLETELQLVNSFDLEIAEIEQKITTQYNEVCTIAKELTKSRKAVFNKIETEVVDMLQKLGMPNVKFKVRCELAKELSSTGQDEIMFLFAANKNGELSDIPKVASGGEMSRVMLCIKSLLSEAKGLPTIIFDEIDIGVSGEVADKMGDIMQHMSKGIQVVSITHLPQIAAKGTVHYKVFKRDTAEDTLTHIEALTDKDRVTEIAKMLSGSNITDAATKNAKSLLKK